MIESIQEGQRDMPAVKGASYPGPTWGQERTGSYKLSSELHVWHDIIIHMHTDTHMHAHTHIHKCNTKFKRKYIREYDPLYANTILFYRRLECPQTEYPKWGVVGWEGAG